MTQFPASEDYLERTTKALTIPADRPGLNEDASDDVRLRPIAGFPYNRAAEDEQARLMTEIFIRHNARSALDRVINAPDARIGEDVETGGKH